MAMVHCGVVLRVASVRGGKGVGGRLSAQKHPSQ